MKYRISAPPYNESEISIHECKREGFLPYRILSIGREGYLIEALIENSDEAWLPMGRMVHNLQIGRYSSIAEGIHFLIGRGKDSLRVTTSAAKVFHQNELSNDKKYYEKGSVIIENDVWVGRNASFMSGVTVHNGAIVAARSHVVSDVPPYAIVGGNPAKVIKYRFDDETIKKLLEIQWWYWSQEKIRENAAYFDEDIQRFCERFYPEAHEEIVKVRNARESTDIERYFMIVDYDDYYSVLPDVVDEFIAKFLLDANKELILYWIERQHPNRNFYLQMVQEMIMKIQNNKQIMCKISLKFGTENEIKLVMPTVKTLIINRCYENIRAMCYSEIYGENVQVISGVDFPLKL